MTDGNEQRTDTDAPQIETAPQERRRGFWRRLIRLAIKIVLIGVAAIVGIVLAYVLFFLHYAQSTPNDWKGKTGPAEGFEIPEVCAIEEVETNAYTRPEYEGYSVHRFRFQPDSEEITEFFVDWFEPQGDRPATGYPLLINGPITGGGMEIENIFSRYFSDAGIAVCLVHRPKTYDAEPMRLDRTGYWWRMMTRQTRLAYRWALEREEIDAQRTASFGISNGGFRHTFFAAAEPNVRAHIICLAGAGLVDIFAVSEFVKEARAAEMENRGLDEESFRAWLETNVELEPADYAPHADPDSILMICSRFDTTVPYRNGCQLWEAFGQPEFIALPAGHYTAAFAIPYIQRSALKFMRQRFESVGSE